jgi:choline-sulfatase
MANDHPRQVSRRRLLQGGAAAAAAMALGPGGAHAETFAAPYFWRQPAASPFGQGARRRPNILILMVDEQRFPTPYESPALTSFRSRYLTTQQTLARTGVELRRHYAAATACAPSRTSLYTGQYPSLHGVTQVDGAAKGPVEPDLFWLDPATVPTIGDYFLNAGYKTYWRGKWHISYADIIEPGTWEGLVSYDVLGRRDPNKEQLYMQAERLATYGFSGWMGREPHGRNPLDSGSSAGIYKPTGQRCSSRDTAFASQTIELLQRLEAAPDTEPWFMVCSFVNPHDIALWGLFTRLGQLFPQVQYTFDFSIGSEVPVNLFDSTFATSQNEDLTTKPRAQASYRDTYSQWIQPVLGPDYYRFYYQLHRNVDTEMGRVYEALQRSRFFQDTIVVFTSDHGDMLGAHGGMHQKWYVAYEEALHVPLIIANPRFTNQGTGVEIPTSHVDVLPTLLGLAGLEPESLRRYLTVDHSEARPLVGRDLSSLVQGSGSGTVLETPVYFMTDDDAARGLNQGNFIGLSQQVAQPNHLDTVIVRRGGQLWKYSEYRDDPQFWSSPRTQDLLNEPLLPAPREPGTYTQPFQVTLKTQPVAPQPRDYELYNLSTDPLELRNLALDASFNSTKSALAALLQEQRQAKRLTPQVTNP